MALHTLGTAGTTTLSAFFMPAATQIGGVAESVTAPNSSPADIASMRAHIWNDQLSPSLSTTAQQLVYPGGFEFAGGQALLHVPNRGVLKVLPGDVVAYDANGWPILVSYAAISGKFASTSWSHS